MGIRDISMDNENTEKQVLENQYKYQKTKYIVKKYSKKIALFLLDCIGFLIKLVEITARSMLKLLLFIMFLQRISK